jgi:FkbM family methyltransferase
MNKFLEEWGATLGLDVNQDGFISMPEKCRRLKIDVGLSWSAIHAISWLEEDEELFCIGFEPLQENLIRLKNLLRSNSRYSSIADRFLIIPCALSDEDGMATFYATKDSGQSSLLEPIKFALRDTVRVPAFRLDTVFSIVSPSRFPVIDAIKTDCQGGDLLVLRGGIETLRRTAIVVTETESTSYQHATNSAQVIENFLSDLGFVYLNKPSKLRLSYRDKLQWLDRPTFRWVSLTVSFLRRYFLNLQTKSVNARVHTVDPTFVNSKYLDAVQRGEIFVRQWN